MKDYSDFAFLFMLIVLTTWNGQLHAQPTEIATNKVKNMVLYSVDSILSIGKISAKAALCLYTGYLCVHMSIDALYALCNRLKTIDYKYVIQHIKEPAKHLLIIAGLALITVECSRSLRVDLSKGK